MTDALRYPWDPEPAPVIMPADPDASPPAAKPRGRRPASVTRSLAQRPSTAPNWLYHHLTVCGPGEQVDAFAAAGRGAGVIPWRLDGAEVEGTVFHLAAAQPAHRRTLTVEGCRILARQFREKVETHQARAAALVGHSFACPFDLHVLLPVPDEILLLGPTHPRALTWLAVHWGITDRLRQVVMRDKATTGRRLPEGHAVTSYGFFTDGETPQAAIDAIAPRWPALRFRLVARPQD